MVRRFGELVCRPIRLSPEPPGQCGADGTDAIGGPVQGDGSEQAVAAYAEPSEEYTRS